VKQAYWNTKKIPQAKRLHGARKSQNQKLKLGKQKVEIEHQRPGAVEQQRNIFEKTEKLKC